MKKIMAVLARMDWMCLDENDERKLIPAGSFLIEALVELDEVDCKGLRAAVFSGIQAGASAFNEATLGAAKPHASVRGGRFLEARDARLLMLNFTATRADLRRHRPMTEIDTFQAAAWALDGLGKSLPSCARVISLQWNPSLVSSALSSVWLALPRSVEMCRNNSLGADFPELAREIELWDLAAASGPPTATSSRLRI